MSCTLNESVVRELGLADVDADVRVEAEHQKSGV